MKTIMCRMLAAIAAVMAVALPATAQAQSVEYNFSVISPNNTNVVLSGYVVKTTPTTGVSGSFDQLYVTGYTSQSGAWVDLGTSGLLINGGTATYLQTGTPGVYYVNSLGGTFNQTDGYYQVSGTMPSINSAVYDFGYSVDSSFGRTETDSIANNYKINNLIYATMFFNSAGTPVQADGTIATSQNTEQTISVSTAVPEIDGSKINVLAFLVVVMLLVLKLRGQIASGMQGRMVWNREAIAA